MKKTPEAIWARGALGRKTAAAPRLLFGQVREDASVEAGLLPPLTANERMFVIASAGCTAFSLAARTEAEVHAIDINPAQIALCHLKQALIARLSREAFLNALDHDVSRCLQEVASDLDAETMRFWEANRFRLRRGLNHSGYVDRALRRLVFLFRSAVVPSDSMRRLLSASSLDEQAAIHAREWKTWRWDLSARIAFSRRLLRLIYGEEMLTSLPPEFSALIKDKVERFATGFPARTNPYLWQTFAGRYASGEDAALPVYVQSDAWNELKKGSGRSPQFQTAETAVWLERQPRHSLHFLALSNILDVLENDASKRLWQAVSHAAAPAATIVVRSMLRASPPLLPDGLPLHFDAETSLQATRQDRSVICGAVFVFKAPPMAFQTWN